MKYLVLACLLLAGCANQPVVDYASVAEKYRPLKAEYPKRITPELQADCNNTTNQCTVSAGNLDRLMTIITRQNDEIERRIDAYNDMVEAVSHSEYISIKLREANAACESQRTQDGIIGTVKTVAYIAACGALLIK